MLSDVTSSSADFISHLTELAMVPAVLHELRREVDALRTEIHQLRGHAATDDLLNVRTAAKMLGMTPAALRQAVYRGSLPALRIGRRLRFRREDLLGQAA
jgi:excisionase family DNA binding protein